MCCYGQRVTSDIGESPRFLTEGDSTVVIIKGVYEVGGGTSFLVMGVNGIMFVGSLSCTVR